jgi:GTP-sensing pleiotropic transcriptional regulator CodY
MFEILEKFVKKLEKLENYYVLRQEPTAVIVGTKIIIKEHKEILGNVFQPFSKNVDRELPVFFMINIGKSLRTHEQFIKNKLPILNWNPKMNKDIQSTLDNFVKEWM